MQHIIGPYAIETVPPGEQLDQLIREIIFENMDVVLTIGADPRAAEVQACMSRTPMSRADQIWLRDLLIWL